MDLQIGYLPQTFILVMARVTAMVGGVGFFGKARIPMRFRVAIALGITLVLLPVIPPAWSRAGAPLTSLPALVFGVLGEILLGAAMALVCDVFMGIFSFAGHIISFGSSLNMAQAIDPVNGANENIIEAFLQMLFLLVFILCDGHLVLLKLLAGSFQVIPPNMDWLDDRMGANLLSLGSVIFVWGLKLAAPLVAAIFIVDLSMGLISRMAPDFDVMFLSLPFKLVVGLGMLGLILRFGSGVFSRLVELAVSCYVRLLGQLVGTLT